MKNLGNPRKASEKIEEAVFAMGSTVVQTNISTGKLPIHDLNPFETTMGNICAFVRKEKKVKTQF